MASEMYVVKRDGESEIVSFDKILRRIKRIGQEADIKINYTSLAMKVIDQLYDKISTAKIDELTAEQCASMSSIHYDYGTLASHITISNHHKNTESNFLTVMRELYNYNDKHGNHSPLITRELLETVDEHYTVITERIDFKRDYVFDYFGFKTLEKTYLMRINGKVVERPQHMWMRVSLGIHGKDVESALRTYDLMSQKFFTHATPTLFNAGTPRPQLSSCFLLSMENDSIEGVYNTLKDCALISKWAGGIGLHIHNVRATHSHIRGTNGTSNGIVPMLRVFNNTAKYVDQCLDPDTIIYSKRGPLRIKNTVVGDEVVTDDGNFYPIRKVLNYPNFTGDMQSIDIKHTMQPLLVTDMHPLYVVKNEKFIQTKFKRLVCDLDRKLVVPEFVEARDVRENDFVGFPIPRFEQDVAHFSEDDCRMYGILVGSNAVLSTVCCITSISSSNTLGFVDNYLNNICTRHVCKENNSVIFEPCSSFKFTQEMISNDKGEKIVLPNMLHLPKNKTLKLLQGLLESSASFDQNRIQLETSSHNVVETVRYLLLRLGILTSGYTKNRCHPLWKKRKIILSIPKKQEICDLFPDVVTVCKNFKFFEHNGYLFSIVRGNKSLQLNKRVVDIEVDHDDHHNFLTHHGLVHNGGGKRNGSFAIYMEPWHADIEKFLEMRKNHGDEELKARDLFYALWIPDLFMNRVKNNGMWTLMCPDECPGLSDVYGEEFEALYTKYENAGKGRTSVSARELWFKVLDAQMETGTPYLCYKDTANNKSNQKNIGVIKSSNLCVAPETTVLTDRGHIRIDTLENQKVNVWNGEEFSEVEIKRTGENQPLIEVHTNDGSVLTCTPYHKFYIQTTFARSKIIQKEAQHLNQGDKIIKFSYPIINGTDDMFYPYTHGFFCGDGTYSQQAGYAPVKCEYKSMESSFFCSRHSFYETENNRYKVYDDTLYCNAISNEKKPKIYLYGEKKKLLQHIKYRTISEYNDRITVELPIDIEDKFYVPLNHSLKCKLDWFSGYCDADGSIARNGENQQLQIASINKDFLLKIKLMLQTCGINSKVKKNRDPGDSSLPDGKGGRALFETKEINRLLITSVDLQKLIKLGFSPHRLVIDTEHILQRAASQFTKIAKIVDNNRVDNTFCFTEPKRHMGVFNGILTGQCSEIMEVSTPKETAVCNLASIGLPTFVDKDSQTFDYDKLREVAGVITDNLNKVIDVNYYPTEKTRVSNLRHRPIGVGVQGLADVFMLLNVAFHSEEAKEINKRIFETIYYGALEKSAELSAIHGPYETYGGSPASRGILQFDMWNVTPSEHLDWAALKDKIVRSGLRNSLLLAPMPTASTSQILGFNECFEPFTSNIYSRRTMAGEFVLTNKYLMRELIDLGIWNNDIKNSIIANQGSVQHIEGISESLKLKYKTVWEIPMRHVIDMAADRGAFICQSQSLNLWQEDPNYNSLTSMHFYAWSKGLKTGIYYLRRRAKHRAQQFTIEPKKNEECEMCSA